MADARWRVSAGGVVGGVVFLILIVAAIVFFNRNRENLVKRPSPP